MKAQVQQQHIAKNIKKIKPKTSEGNKKPSPARG
jgi:hypothetical protein